MPILLTVFIIVSIGLIIDRALLVRNQYHVRLWLEGAGGYVIYSGQRTPESWLPWTNGEPILDTITEAGITSGSPPVDRRELERLYKLRFLKVAKFEVADLIDDDLKAISRCSGLQELNVAGSSVTGKGFAYLEGMPKLKSLDVTLCEYSPEEMKSLLETLPRIEEIYAAVGYDQQDMIYRMKFEVGSKAKPSN